MARISVRRGPSSSTFDWERDHFGWKQRSADQGKAALSSAAYFPNTQQRLVAVVCCLAGPPCQGSSCAATATSTANRCHADASGVDDGNDCARLAWCGLCVGKAPATRADVVAVIDGFPRPLGDKVGFNRVARNAVSRFAVGTLDVPDKGCKRFGLLTPQKLRIVLCLVRWLCRRLTKRR